MRKAWVLLAIIVLAFNGCKKTEKEPQYSGEIVLSSELLQSGQDYIFYGFSFTTGEISTYSITSSVHPDLSAIHVIMGENISVDLQGSNDVAAFYPNGTFGSATEAEDYFNNYTEVVAEDFQPLAHSIQENQVWTVQTASNHFAKIWIEDISYKTGPLSEYADVRIRYQYQPDGSGTFQ
jgi:hypothetical protein